MFTFGNGPSNKGKWSIYDGLKVTEDPLFSIINYKNQLHDLSLYICMFLLSMRYTLPILK